MEKPSPQKERRYSKRYPAKVGKPKKMFGPEWINVAYCACVLGLNTKMSWIQKEYSAYNKNYVDDDNIIYH